MSRCSVEIRFAQYQLVPLSRIADLQLGPRLASLFHPTALPVGRSYSCGPSVCLFVSHKEQERTAQSSWAENLKRQAMPFWLPEPCSVSESGSLIPVAFPPLGGFPLLKGRRAKVTRQTLWMVQGKTAPFLQFTLRSTGGKKVLKAEG